MRRVASNLSYLFLVIMVAASVCLTGCSKDSTNPATPDPAEGGSSLRIISLSGVITEVLFELGQGENIVGIDITSTYPSEGVEKKAQLGHTTQLNAEGILALNPDIIFCLQEDAEKPVLKQLASSGLKVVALSVHPYFDNAVQLAQQLNTHLSLNEAAVEELASNAHADSLAVAKYIGSINERPRVLFIYARGTGRLFVGGADTPVAAMISKAGGTNAISEIGGYKELTSEALVSSNPDVILMFSSGLSSLDGVEGLQQITGMSQTKAYRNQHVIAMDGHYLSSFGPRAAQAALELAKGIHESGI